MRDRAKFVVKRCYRFGETVRYDVMEAMKVSEATATETLGTAIQLWERHVYRKGNKIFPRPGSTAPVWASDNALLKELSEGAKFKNCGLRESELPIFTVEWGRPIPPDEGVFTFICQSIAIKRIIDIHYVGLKQGDTGSIRAVFPLGLERKSDLWRLVAHDLNTKEFTIKTFQLSRILSATRSDRSKPRSKPLGMISPVQASTSRPYELNPDFTEEQKKIVSNQLMWCKGKVDRPPRVWHEFDIEFAGAVVSENIVWPLLIPGKK